MRRSMGAPPSRPRVRVRAFEEEIDNFDIAPRTARTITGVPPGSVSVALALGQSSFTSFGLPSLTASGKEQALASSRPFRSSSPRRLRRSPGRPPITGGGSGGEFHSGMSSPLISRSTSSRQLRMNSRMARSVWCVLVLWKHVVRACLRSVPFRLVVFFIPMVGKSFSLLRHIFLTLGI